MTHLLTAIQGLALIAVLVGFALALPFPMALVVDGLLLLLVATAVEVLSRRRAPAHSAPRRPTGVRGVS